ncbi:hypothetical protein [Methanospirillum lacunae]|uniref:hypothetical protein n=1 Tax=Methanospirillum lacunae TaxID=668570 RepID=UPI0015E8677A|nr:hypothetical protein [Methanospirillum lacunae]
MCLDRWCPAQILSLVGYGVYLAPSCSAMYCCIMRGVLDGGCIYMTEQEALILA